MFQRQPGCLEHVVHELIALLAGYTLVARVIQLNPKDRAHRHGVA